MDELTDGQWDGPPDSWRKVRTHYLIRMMFESIPSNASLIVDKFLGKENMKMPFVS